MDNEQTMANAEAIRILTIDGAYLYPDRCYNYKAFELAIKALENEEKVKHLVGAMIEKYSEDEVKKIFEKQPFDTSVLWSKFNPRREADNENNGRNQ